MDNPQNKENSFLNWLCGEDVKFPYFRMEDKPFIPKIKFQTLESKKYGKRFHLKKAGI